MTDSNSRQQSDPPLGGGQLTRYFNRKAIVPALALAVLAIAIGGWLLSGHEPAASPAGAAGMRAARVVAVVAAQPELKEFAHEVEALGTVRANESVDVIAKVSDRIAAIHFSEGQQVRKGALLVELDSGEARADLAAARAAERDSRSQYNRSQELFATRVLSEAQLEQLQSTLLANEARVAAAQARVEDRTIRAPFSGRVGLRNVSVGGLVGPGTVITTLDDLSVVKVDFSVPEVFLASLRPGLTIQAHTSAYSGETFTGRVASVATRLDPVTRSVAVRAHIDNRDGRLRPGMFLTLTLVRTEGEALVVPEQAIVPENDAHFVFIVDAEGRARRRNVTLGRRRPGEVEVLHGLTSEDLVIVEGALNVRDGAEVRIQNVQAGGPRT